MKRLYVLTKIALATAISWMVPTTAFAGAPTLVSGGGTGTFDADLDADEDIDGSHFGFAVIIGARGSAIGHFECLMAGNADILGLPLMAVEGKVSFGSVNGDTAIFGGVARVNLGGGHIFRNVPFTVTVKAGGAGAGKLQLTVIEAFDGVPGDEVADNGNYDLPIETVAAGQIKIR